METEKRRRWSWQVGSIFGIGIRIHITLIALLVWSAVVAPISRAGTHQGFVQWTVLVLVFACIVAHELGHALAARRFGFQTREILLLPIGGIAQMQRMPERPAQELLVALAGPAINVAIAGLLGAVIGAAGWRFGIPQPTPVGTFVVSLFWSNVALAAFNLLPAFPMDGGRVLRALLVTRFGREHATKLAGRIGKVLAILFVIAGLTYGTVMLSVIGLFVWFASEQESAMVAMSSALAEAIMAEAMIRPSHVIDASATIDNAAEELLTGGHRELAISEGGRIVSVATAVDLAGWMNSPGAHVSIGSVMKRDIPVVDPTTSLSLAPELLEQCGVLLVGDRGAVIGTITADQLAIFSSLHRNPKSNLAQHSVLQASNHEDLSSSSRLKVNTSLGADHLHR